MLRTDLLTFGVTSTVFKIAGEMRRLLVNFDNPAIWMLCIHVVLNGVIFPQILDIVTYAQHFLPVKFFLNITSINFTSSYCKM